MLSVNSVVDFEEMTFKGFSDSESFTQLPDSFFQKLLHEIEDVAELKVTLFFLWRVEHMEGPFRALRLADFVEKTLGLSADEVITGLESAVRRGSILKRSPARASAAGTGERTVEGSEQEADVFYFLNSPRGRAAAEAFAQGKSSKSTKFTSMPVVERPNAFKLYEENIGPLTPMIADTLKDAEETYSQEWVADALEIAVKNNKRNWKYIEAILKRWKEEGRAEKQDRRNPEKDRRKYVEGEFSDFIEH